MHSTDRKRPVAAVALTLTVAACSNSEDGDADSTPESQKRSTTASG